MRITLRRGTDQIVTLVGLRTSDTQQYLNQALVKASLVDSKGLPVPSFQNVPMTYVDGSDGDYEWHIDGPQMMLPKNIEYSAIFTARQAGYDYRIVHVVSVVEGC